MKVSGDWEVTERTRRFASELPVSYVSARYIEPIYRFLGSEGDEMKSRGESLEFALLGLLAQNSLHGYELRKRIGAIYGPFRALSFSVLYPALRRLVEGGLIAEAALGERGGLSRRSRIVYAITEAGRNQFAEMAEGAGPEAWGDESFGIRFAFFSPTSASNRVRIMEGRLTRLREKVAILRDELNRDPIGMDRYFSEWRRHSLETAEREIAWLEEMIKSERKSS